MPNTQIPLNRSAGSGVLPNGIYRLKIEAVEEKTGPSGHPYLNMRYRVLINGQASQTAVWDVISLSPAARFKVDQFLDALAAPEEGNVSAQWFVGKFVWASLRTGEFNGNVRNEVNQYLTKEVAAEQLESALANPAAVSSFEEVAAPAAQPAPQRQAAPQQRAARPGQARQSPARVVAEMDDEFPS
jgi:hypothetical protein